MTAFDGGSDLDRELSVIEARAHQRAVDIAKVEERPVGVDLGIRTLADLLEEEAGAPESRFLVEGMLATDDYGVYAAKPKVGKTWLASDLGVSVATGTTFMDKYPTTEANVLVFAGEGGRRRVLRRLDAVARSKGLELAELDNLRLSLRIPFVGEETVRRALGEALDEEPVDLIIAEPFYLMARGVGRGQLNEIGAVLGAVQSHRTPAPRSWSAITGTRAVRGSGPSGSRGLGCTSGPGS